VLTEAHARVPLRILATLALAQLGSKVVGSAFPLEHFLRPWIQGGGKTMKICMCLIMLVLCVTAPSCIQYRNVTNDPAFRTDYMVNATYRLKQDALLSRAIGEGPERPLWEMAAPGRSFAVHLKNVEELQMNPNKWPGTEVVSAGTLVRFRHLGLTKATIDAFYAAPYATFINGPRRGERVDLRDVSRVEGDTAIFVDPAWLESVPE
jgi:hypothetical protein